MVGNLSASDTCPLRRQTNLRGMRKQAGL